MYEGLLLIDKPKGPTSHDVVAAVKRQLRTKVGHAGTLDPMASGLLVLGLGEGTKLLTWLTQDTKSYETTILFGIATDSADATGLVTANAPVPALTPELLRDGLTAMVGPMKQTPPRYSAIKVDGVRSYDRARTGEDFELASRDVELLHAEAIRVDAVTATVRLTCSKGFYVRSFAVDLAARLGTLGHLTMLRRTASGVFSVPTEHSEPTITFRPKRSSPSDLLQNQEGIAVSGAPEVHSVETVTLNTKYVSISEAAKAWPQLVLNEQQVIAVRQGKHVSVDVADQDPIALMSGPELIAIAAVHGGKVRVHRGMSHTAEPKRDPKTSEQ